jgi:hypothetical protein
MNHNLASRLIFRPIALGCIAFAMTACAKETGQPYASLAGHPVTELMSKVGPPDWSRTYSDGSKDIKYEHFDASVARAIAPRCSATFAVNKEGRIEGQFLTGSPQDCIYLRYRLGI